MAQHPARHLGIPGMAGAFPHALEQRPAFFPGHRRIGELPIVLLGRRADQVAREIPAQHHLQRIRIFRPAVAGMVVTIHQRHAAHKDAQLIESFRLASHNTLPF